MFQLTIEDGNGRTTDRITFEHGSYIIGRQDGCDILLPSGSVSRRHARIFVDQGRCYIEDLGSANGITVDGQRVVKQRDLGTASLVEIGDFYLYLEHKRAGNSHRQNVMQTLFVTESSDHCKLVRINDGFAGEEFSLSEVENTIGRTDENFILLSDPSISRHHARIVRQGESYTLQDSGSSNGSRINGKQVKAPVSLRPGDRVHFGNVEFVFVEGLMRVDPAEYVGSGSPSRVWSLGLSLMIVAGVATAGLVVFGYLSPQPDAEPEAPVARTAAPTPAQSALATGEEHLAGGEWEEAVKRFDEALAFEPAQAEAIQLKLRAQREQEARESYERGEVLVEQGRRDDARRVLEAIPAGTAVYERARGTLEHIDKTDAYNLKNEAARLSTSDDASELSQAHARLKRALRLSPADAEALRLVRTLEKKLAKKKVDFEAYSPE